MGQKPEYGLIRHARFHSRPFRDLQINYGVIQKDLCTIVDTVRHVRGVIQGHPVTIVTDHIPLTEFLKSGQNNLMVIRWPEPQSQLDTMIEYLAGKKNMKADALHRIYNHIEIPPTRYYTSSPRNKHTCIVQLSVTRYDLAFPTSYLQSPPPTITSYSKMPSRVNNSITGFNSIRMNDNDDPEYWELRNITYQEHDRPRLMTC